MPFTFSHPALVLPLSYFPKKWFSLTGLVVGSLTPDFEYFLRMKVKSNYSHTLDGLLWFDLPLGILLAFIFHGIMRNQMFDSLPEFLRSRLFGFKGFNWVGYFKMNWYVVIISILIGAAFHLFWDSFTHPQGYFISVIPTLASTVDVQGRHIPVYKILQHVSTILGGIVIAFAVCRLPSCKVDPASFRIRYWATFGVLTVAVVTLRFWSGVDKIQLGDLIVTCIAASLISLILTSLLNMKISKAPVT